MAARKTGQTPDGKVRRRPSYIRYDVDATFAHAVAQSGLTEEQLLKIINEQRRPVYATKTVQNGPMLDVQVYPEFTRRPPPEVDVKKYPRNRQTQKNLNDRNSRKACEQLINENFTEADYWLTLSYYERTAPQDDAQAKKDFANYIKRVNYHLKKEGLPPAKYVHVVDWTKNGRRVRCHHHFVIDNGLTMQQLIALWGMGRRNEARQLELDERGLSGLSYYITKPHAPDTEEVKHKKSWSCSKGLKQPKERKDHRTFRRRRVEKMAQSEGKIFKEMEEKYPAYWCESGSAYFNGCVGLFYVQAQMRLKAQPGDMVRISGREDALEKLEHGLAKRLSAGGVFRVLEADYTTPGRETVTLLTGSREKRITYPARICIVIDTGQEEKTA